MSFYNIAKNRTTKIVVKYKYVFSWPKSSCQTSKVNVLIVIKSYNNNTFLVALIVVAIIAILLPNVQQ